MGILMTCDRTTLLFLISLCYFESNNIFISGVNGNSPRKVYGGKDVQMYRYTQIVSVQYQNHHICGGVIISESHILTSASCVTADTHVVYGNLKILTGTKDLSFGDEDVFAKFHEIAYVISHKEYNPQDAWRNDIAILKTTSNIIFNVMSSSAILTTESLSTKFWVLGWGIDPLTQIMTRYLQILNVYSMNNYLCNEQYYYMNYLGKTQHCLILPETAQITQGNSGSPVMIGRKIIGIISSISWNPDDPVVYTRVISYRSWIDGILLEV